MKINAVRAFIIASIVIILLYALGLFLPIELVKVKAIDSYLIANKYT